MTAVMRVKVRGSRSYHLAPLGSTLTICGAVVVGPLLLPGDRGLCARCGLTFRAANRDSGAAQGRTMNAPIGLNNIDKFCPARAPAWTLPHEFADRHLEQPHYRRSKRWLGIKLVSRHEVCRHCFWDRTANRSWWDYIRDPRIKVVMVNGG